MTRDDPGLFVVAGRVSRQLEYFGGEVFHDGGQVHRRTSAHPLGVVSLAQEPVYATDGELESGAIRTRLCLSLDFTAFSATRHGEMW
jgi:hypothetical protein